ncbi:MAG TPA: peptide ABC transporter substrate-binding protein, partial [Vicinamibacteria bacterium]
MHRVGVCALALACACSGPRDPDPPTNQLLVIGYDREPDTLNRFSTHILEDTMICISEGLTVWNERMEAVPVLAEVVPSPENGLVRVLEDGRLEVTWKLRSGIRWHDGEPFTSRDVAFTVETINDPAYNPESTEGFDLIESVVTPDETTAVVTYRRIYAAYQDQFWRGALPRHVLDGKDLNAFPEYDRKPIGTGPYQVEEWRTGEYLLLTRNEDYWRGAPAIEKLLFRFLPSSNTRMNQLRSGEVQVVDNVPLDKVDELEGIPGVEVSRTMGNSYAHVALNLREVPPFRDLRVRQAIAHAIDREAIARDVLGGVVKVVDSVIQPMSWAYHHGIKLYEYDPTRAKALLREAGFEDRDGDGIVEKDGVPLAFPGTTRSGHAEWEMVLQVIQAQLKAVGIAVEIRNYEPTMLGELWFGGKLPFFLSAWTLPADPEITLFYASDRTPPRGRNIYYYENEELTRILYASDQTVDREARKKLLFEAQEILAREVPEIPLYNRTLVSAFPEA